MNKILVVEDDESIAESLSGLLRSNDFHVTRVKGQKAAQDALSHEGFDLSLVDIALEDGNGFAVCSYIKSNHPSTQVIFLTASDDEYSTVAGFEMGAVDYVAKPFRPQELLARIKSALRRHNGARQTVYSFGSLTVDPSTAQVLKDGEELSLSALEYRLLLHFLQHPTGTVTRDALRDALWEVSGEYVTDNALNVAIRRLREKIEEDPSNPAVIATVRGIGWKLGA